VRQFIAINNGSQPEPKVDYACSIHFIYSGSGTSLYLTLSAHAMITPFGGESTESPPESNRKLFGSNQIPVIFEQIFLHATCELNQPLVYSLPASISSDVYFLKTLEIQFKIYIENNLKLTIFVSK